MRRWRRRPPAFDLRGSVRIQQRRSEGCGDAAAEGMMRERIRLGLALRRLVDAGPARIGGEIVGPASEVGLDRGGWRGAPGLDCAGALRLLGRPRLRWMVGEAGAVLGDAFLHVARAGDGGRSRLNPTVQLGGDVGLLMQRRSSGEGARRHGTPPCAVARAFGESGSLAAGPSCGPARDNLRTRWRDRERRTRRAVPRRGTRRGCRRGAERHSPTSART